MNKERFIRLFEAYLNETLTPEEVTEFQQAMQDARFNALLDDLLKQAYRNPAYREENQELQQAAYQNILSAIHNDEENSFWPVSRSRTQLYRWLAGIAALLFITIGGARFFLKTKQPPPATNNYTADIKPGTNKATLTLANGRKIVLSTAINGQLATQANVKITKTSSGEIIYTAEPQNEATREIQYNTLTTARSEQFQVILPDDSHAWLDAASSLRYPVTFTGSERKVELTGQAYFEVVHNAAMPFKVKTPTQEVEVLGTHFNIKSYSDEPATKTTLLEGSVKISTNTLSKIIKPGQQASNSGGSLKITDVDTEESVAWKNGYFMFDNENLESIMRKISRWYDVDIQYEDTQVAKQQFGGSTTRFTNVSKVLEALQKSGNVHFKIEGKKIIVRK